MVVVAFSGIGNTGKSSIIKKLQARYSGHNVMSLGEEARDAMEEVGTESMAKFQENIFYREVARAKRIEENRDNYDLILVDRTWVDQLAYLVFNLINGDIKADVPQYSLPNVYDHVIYFTVPIKKNTAFRQYNDVRLSMIMNAIIYSKFDKTELTTYRNGKMDQKLIIRKIDSLLEKQ